MQNSQHGGKREGSGRPSRFDGPTELLRIRLPVDVCEAIKRNGGLWLTDLVRCQGNEPDASNEPSSRY